MKTTVFKNIISYDTYIMIGEDIHYDYTSLVRWKIENVSDTFLGSFPCGKIEVELNVDILKDYVGKIIKVYLKDNRETNYTLMGTYTVDKANFDDMNKTLTVIGFDVALQFNQSVTIDLNIPKKGLTIIREIARMVNVEIGSIDNLVFNNHLFSKINYDSTTSARQLIAEYAQINGCSACINSLGQLIFKRIDAKHDVVDIVEPQHYSEIEIDKTQEPINTLVLSNTDAEDNIVVRENENDPVKEIKLKDNSWIYFDRESTKTTVFNQYKGLTYTPFKMDLWDFAHLDLFDKIQFKSTQNEVFIGYIQNITYEYNGGLMTTISSKQLPQTKTNYSLSKPNPILKKTLLELDKVKGELRLNIIEVKDRLHSVEQTATAEGITTIVRQTINNNRDELKGEKGDRGEKGVDGQNGQNGRDGQNGKDAAIFSDSEPQDKTQSWIDSKTLQLKHFVNGQWVVIGDVSSSIQHIQQLYEELKQDSVSKDFVNALEKSLLENKTTTDNYKKLVEGQFNELKKKYENVSASTDELTKTFTQDATGFTVGAKNSRMKIKITDNRLSFLENEQEVAFVSGQRLFINSGVFLSELIVGRHKTMIFGGVQGTIEIYIGE